jgi:hypothetical protein
VIVSDNGAPASSDSFEIQLLQNGNIVYQEGNALKDSCGGGVSIIPGSGGSGGGSGASGGSTPPPESACNDFVTGGGWIVGTPTADKANFAVQGGKKNNAYWGGLNYIDHGMRMHVKSENVTGYTALSATGRQITYSVTIDGAPGTATVQVYDNGEAGRNDTFSITLSNGYHASGDLGGARPGGGNIQLHEAHCNQGTQKSGRPVPAKSTK